MSEIIAPFTAEQVERLNRYQVDSSNHPFTCGGERTDENHLDGEGVLMATTEGWKCPYCPYTQNYAHDFMAADPEPPREWGMAYNLCGEEARADPNFPENLSSAFRNEPSGRLQGRFRGIILSLISAARLPEALPLLVEQLQSPDPWLRYWAARGLRLLNTPSASQALAEGSPT